MGKLPERIQRVVEAILAWPELYEGFALELAKWVAEAGEKGREPLPARRVEARPLDLEHKAFEAWWWGPRTETANTAQEFALLGWKARAALPMEQQAAYSNGYESGYSHGINAREEGKGEPLPKTVGGPAQGSDKREGGT